MKNCPLIFERNIKAKNCKEKTPYWEDYFWMHGTMLYQKVIPLLSIFSYLTIYFTLLLNCNNNIIIQRRYFSISFEFLSKRVTKGRVGDLYIILSDSIAKLDFSYTNQKTIKVLWNFFLLSSEVLNNALNWSLQIKLNNNRRHKILDLLKIDKLSSEIRKIKIQ